MLCPGPGWLKCRYSWQSSQGPFARPFSSWPTFSISPTYFGLTRPGTSALMSSSDTWLFLLAWLHPGASCRDISCSRAAMAALATHRSARPSYLILRSFHTKFIDTIKQPFRAIPSPAVGYARVRGVRPKSRCSSPERVRYLQQDSHSAEAQRLARIPCHGPLLSCPPKKATGLVSAPSLRGTVANGSPGTVPVDEQARDRGLSLDHGVARVGLTSAEILTLAAPLASLPRQTDQNRAWSGNCSAQLMGHRGSKQIAVRSWGIFARDARLVLERFA
jgi:hypothetical protein